MQIELLLLVVSALFFASIWISKAGSKLGVPVLLLFLIVGMVFGSDGLGIQFDNIHAAQIISTVALCIILFSGGMDTKFSDVRPVAGPGVVLATLGVLITAIVTGLLILVNSNYSHFGTSLTLLTCLLLASTLSSTDSASVFSILRGQGMKLKHNLRPVLELESGSNDPMAYVLTITFISLILQGGNPQWGKVIMIVLIQLVIGALAGYLLGRFSVRLINRINVDNASLYPILVLSACIFIFAATYYIHGNSYLAVYIGGLVIGNSKFVHKRSTRNFFDGITWLMQLLLFLTLGLLVNPSELKPAIIPGIIISLCMIFISRPLSVFISLIPFRKIKFKDKLFVSWVGLRGATPIVFAILCRAEGVPNSEWIFNIVFFCTLVSLILQGTTIPLVARWLGIAEPPEKQNDGANDFDIEFPEEIKSTPSKIYITAEVLKHGNKLIDLALPDNTLAIMIKRGDKYFVPTGKTILQENDHLMVLSDNEEELDEALQRLGISNKPEEEKKEKSYFVNIFTQESIESLRGKVLENNPIVEMGTDLKDLHKSLRKIKEPKQKKNRKKK